MESSQRGSTALWRAIAAGKSLSPTLLSFFSLLHTIQLVSLCLAVLAVADMERSSDVNAFLRVLTAGTIVTTATRYDTLLQVAAPGMFIASVIAVGCMVATVVVATGMLAAGR